jgi:UDP-N-acetylmuramate: L-alanyl-gamma-D-glutamyl-meso-diaminopimelate ligase
LACRRASTDSPFFVIEADEYDTAFCDKRSKFVHYRPRTAILNNLEFDHADIFADLAAIETQFHHLVRIFPAIGRIVANAAEEIAAAGDGSAAAGRSWSGSTMRPAGRWPRGRVEDEVVVRFRARRSARSRLPLSGRHNRANALAAIAAARHVGVTPEVALDALTRFEGVKRRLELRGTVRGVAVYDDFAHHPTAITLTVEGLRRQVGEARILAVLEPRSNTMKLGVMKDQLPASLTQADKVFCYAANLGWDARARWQPIAAKTVVEDDLDALVAAIVAEARDGDRILVMSNGGFGGIHGKLLAALAWPDCGRHVVHHFSSQVQGTQGGRFSRQHDRGNRLDHRADADSDRNCLPGHLGPGGDAR